jgi:hypothetical protein
MKMRYALLISVSCICLLASCSSYYGGSRGCPGCDYRTYDSQCGRPSCTDNCGMSGYAQSYPRCCL